MNTNSENPFWYHEFDLRQTKILRSGQSNVDFDAADDCCLYVTTMNAMNFQHYIPSVPIDHYML